MAEDAIATPFLTRRAAAALGLAALAEGLAAWWVLSSSAPLPLAGTVPAALLPQVLCGVALALAVFSAPFIARNSGRFRFAGAFFAAAWQALMLGYFLLVSARLAPLENENILQATAALALLAAAVILLAALAPRGYAAAIFIWLVGLPVFGYMLAEVYLWSTGGTAEEWRPETARAAYTCVHWLLNLSPGTAMIGALEGRLAGGEPPATGVFLIFMGAVVAVLALAEKRNK